MASYAQAPPPPSVRLLDGIIIADVTPCMSAANKVQLLAIYKHIARPASGAERNRQLVHGIHNACLV